MIYRINPIDKTDDVVESAVKLNCKIWKTCARWLRRFANWLPRAELPWAARAGYLSLTWGYFYLSISADRVTSGRLVWDCKTILGLENKPRRRAGLCSRVTLCVAVCRETVTSCQMRYHVFVGYIFFKKIIMVKIMIVILIIIKIPIMVITIITIIMF